MSEAAEPRKGFMKVIGAVEKAGNKLPHPFYLFCILIVITLVISLVFAGSSATYERASTTGAAAETVTVQVNSLFGKEILRYLFQNLHVIYFGFSPLSMMALLMLSIGLAENVGLFEAFIKNTLLGAPINVVFLVVSFIAINSSLASNAAVLGTTAVAGACFGLLGLNPQLGIIMAYAAGNAGYAANAFIANLDVLVAGITDSVVKQAGIPYNAHVLQHWFFSVTSSFVLTLLYTFITIKFMKNYFGEAKSGVAVTSNDLTPEEKKALKKAGRAGLIYILLVVAVVVPQNSFLRADDGSILPTSPLLRSTLAILFFLFLVMGATYGRATGKIERWGQLPRMLMKSLESILNFMVISLPASVFIHLFNASGIPTVLGVKGAEFLKAANLNGLFLLIVIVIVTGFLDLFMTSGSSKFMILAPILIPMLYAIGLSPGATSLAYRVGDSAMNAVAPISTDVALIIALLEKYKTDENQVVGMGTVFAGCLPYAISTMVVQIILLSIWYILDLPIGPGVNFFV